MNEKKNDQHGVNDPLSRKTQFHFTQMASDDKLKCPLKGENCIDTRQSPPKAIVDCSPLQPAISKNKEALKIKLMVRRPIAQLVDQGIIPSLKSSPALHEQRKQLERAKTGDILKAKIQQRPDRQELERRHILEHDESHVDPSLAERQRMLKKARLADQLNSQLSHRPGPLELIKKNILHTEEPIERIVKEGLISFKATSEGLLNRPQQPNGYITYEDDSLSSEGDIQNSPAGQDFVETLPSTATAASTEIHDFFIPLTTNDPSGTVYTTVVQQSKLPPPAYYTAIEPFVKPIVKQETSNLFAELCQSVIDNSGSSNLTSNKTVSRLSSLPPLTKSAYPLPTPVQNSNKTDAPGKDKNRKKNKLKPMAKTRTIKFHEYKGPPNAQKNGLTSMTNEETSYQLLLKQQNCLLEYLEGLHKSPPSNLQSNTKSMLNENQSSFSVTNSFKQQSSPLASNATTMKPASPVSITADALNNLEMSKLEKMKVSELKLLLKTRNLPVSGPKPQLIERLRPFIQTEANVETMTTSTNSSENFTDDGNENFSNNSPSHMETDTMELHETLNSRTNEALLREQQRKIDELQRKLKESQQELQQMQMKQSQVPVVKMITNEIIQPKLEVLNQKQIFKQQLEAKIQKDKLQKMQLEQQEMQRRKQENSINANETLVPKSTSNFIGQPGKNPNEFVWNGESTILLVNFPDDKKFVLSNNPQTATMQNVLVPISTTAQNINAIIKKMPPPPPSNLHLTQITSPKVSSHSINIIDNQQTNSINIHQQPAQSQSKTQPQHQQTLPSISKVMLNNVTTSLPFSSPSLIKKEYSLFDPTLASNSNTNNFNMIPNNLLLNPTDMDTMSPMQQSNCDDSCNSFDLFLNETAQSHSGPSKMDEQYSTKELNAMNETIKKEPCQMTVSNDDHCPVDLKAFDDLELMELAHQLDMDISDDSCQPIKEELHSQSNGLNSGNQTMVSSCRRELNPSLQPSLMENQIQKLVFDQQQQQFMVNHQQTIGLTPSTSSKDNKLNASMELYGNNDTNNNNNDNNSNNLDSISNNNLMDYNNQFYLGNQNIPITPSTLHLGSMDIEYFDNTLAQFDFQLPSTTSTTPNSNSNSNQIQSSNAMHFDPIDQQWNCDALLQQLWN